MSQRAEYPTGVQLGDVVYWEWKQDGLDGVVVGVPVGAQAWLRQNKVGSRARTRPGAMLWRDGWSDAIAFGPTSLYIDTGEGLESFATSFDTARPVRSPVVLRGGRLYCVRADLVLGVLRSGEQVL